MEPRSIERGNQVNEVLGQSEVLLLQWSHVQLNVETLVGGAPVRHDHIASMEPRSIERGNSPYYKLLRAGGLVSGMRAVAPVRA